MLQHPEITRAMRTGDTSYPYSARRREVGTDPLGNEVYAGDEILEFDDDFYLVSELSPDAIEILEHHNAIYKIAK